MDELDRLYRLLVDTIKSQQPELLARPFEVADIYQSILPYRLHRRALGMETNSDYEMTLLRLLSGERGYMIGDEEMQDALRRELATPNPEPGAFRSYAQSHVGLAGDALRRLEQGSFAGGSARGMPTPSATPPAPPRPPAPAPLPPMPPAPPAAPPAPPPMRSPVTNPSLQQTMSAPPRSTTAEALGGRCRYCSGALPAGRRLTFCPHCGQNLTVQHCPACNTELEVGWKFCTTCGRGVSGA